MASIQFYDESQAMDDNARCAWSDTETESGYSSEYSSKWHPKLKWDSTLSASVQSGLKLPDEMTVILDPVSIPVDYRNIVVASKDPASSVEHDYRIIVTMKDGSQRIIFLSSVYLDVDLFDSLPGTHSGSRHYSDEMETSYESDSSEDTESSDDVEPSDTSSTIELDENIESSSQVEFII